MNLNNNRILVNNINVKKNINMNQVNYNKEQKKNNIIRSFLLYG